MRGRWLSVRENRLPENTSFERVVGCVNLFHAVDAHWRGASDPRADSISDSRRCSVDDVSDARMKLQIIFEERR
jgi:hypothetical protein